MNSDDLVSTLRYCRRVLLGLAKKHGFELLPSHTTYTYGNRPEVALQDERRRSLFIGDTLLPEDAGRPAPSSIALLRSYMQRVQTLQRQEQIDHCVLAFISESAETIREWSDTLDSLAATMDFLASDGERILFEVEYLNNELWITWGSTASDFRLLT